MRAGLLLTSIAVLSLSPSVQAQEMARLPDTPTPSVSVTGEGEARATPDRALITIGVQSRATTAAAAATENARKQRAIIDTLRAMGFAQEQLTTANYAVQPEMQYDQGGQRARVIGYVVSNTVRVDVRRLERAGPAIDAALAKGANNIHGLSFYLADPGPVRRAAIANAVARARADAEALAVAAGGTLGQLLELSSTPMSPGPVFYRREIAAVSDAAMGAATPIEAGEEVIRATVSARWAFLPAR